MTHFRLVLALLATILTSPVFAQGINNPQTNQSALTFNKGQLPGTATNDSASAGNVGEYIYGNVTGTTGATVTITIASPGVVTWTAHGMSTFGLSPVVLSTSGALPTGLVAGTIYWTVPGTVTANTFQLATSIANAIAGTAINTTGSQSGTQTAASSISVATGTNTTITAINLSAGDWEVTGASSFLPAATTSVTYVQSNMSLVLSTTDASLDRITGLAFGAGSTIGANGITTRIVLPTTRVLVSTTTLVYLNVNTGFSVSTVNTYGIIRARRIR